MLRSCGSGRRFPATQPDFGNCFPDFAQQGREGNLPATQWELGLYFHKRFYRLLWQTTAVANPLTHREKGNSMENRQAFPGFDCCGELGGCASLSALP